MSFVFESSSLITSFVGENFRQLAKISSLFLDEFFPDKVIDIFRVFVTCLHILRHNPLARMFWNDLFRVALIYSKYFQNTSTWCQKDKN